MIKNVQELTDKFVAIKIKLEIVKGLIVKFNLTPKHELMVKICNLLLVIKDLEVMLTQCYWKIFAINFC